MICFYIDHKSFSGSMRELAQMSLHYENAKLFDSSMGISLTTCHRIEYYPKNKAINLNSPSAFANFSVIENEALVLERLFRLSLGLESSIVGEGAIYLQVSQAVNEYLYFNSEEQRLLNLLVNAKNLREKFNFYAKNHAQLIYEHMQRSRMVIFFGAGMLNRSVLEVMNKRDYERVLVVSRNEAKARKFLKSLNLPIEVIEPIELSQMSIDRSFDVFIATNNIDLEYEKTIMRFCLDPLASTIVDLCSVPLAMLEGVQGSYYSLYSENTARIIRENNKKFFPLLKDVENFLSSQQANWYTLESKLINR